MQKVRVVFLSIVLILCFYSSNLKASDTLSWGLKSKNKWLGNNVFKYNKFRVDVSPFTSFSFLPNIEGFQNTFYIEPKFSVMPQLSVGLQFGGGLNTGVWKDKQIEIISNNTTFTASSRVANVLQSNGRYYLGLTTYGMLTTDWYFRPKKNLDLL